MAQPAMAGSDLREKWGNRVRPEASNWRAGTAGTRPSFTVLHRLDEAAVLRRGLAQEGRFSPRGAFRDCSSVSPDPVAADPPPMIVTDQLRTYPAAKAEIARLTNNIKRVYVEASVRMSNRAESSHQPTREREGRMRGFRVPQRNPSVPVELRSDPADLRAQETFVTRLALSEAARRAPCRMT